MSSPAPHPGTAQQQPAAPRTRFIPGKIAVAILLFAVLLSAGFHGRNRARVQAKLSDLLVLRDQLQLQLETEHRPLERLNVLTNTSPPTFVPPLPSQARAGPIVLALKSRIAQFEADAFPDKLSAADKELFNLSQATLANAANDFAQALAVLAASHAASNAAANATRAADLLEVRADAFYGLGRTAEALDSYSRWAALQPNRLAALGRVADCLAILGKRSEALTAYAALASAFNAHGDAAVIEGKFDTALANYTRALQIQSQLIQHHAQTNLATNLIQTLAHRGNAFLAHGKTDGAVADFQSVAAACADAGRFNEAVGWQEKAVNLAPPQKRAELQSRLDHYKSRRP